MAVKVKSLKSKVKSRFGRIGVLMGGPSTEREISLKSGKAVFLALSQLGLDVTVIDIKTGSLKANIDLIKSHKIDCAFLALHGAFGEDGQIQQLLEVLKIPYTGSGVAASRLAMDKVSSLKVFQMHGITVPKHIVVYKTSGLSSRLVDNLVFPLVVKPASHGSSIGLSIINRKSNLNKALELAFQFDKKAIVEEYIEGREMTVGILSERALPVIEIRPKRKFFDYKAKYTPGLTDYIIPANLEEFDSKCIRKAALTAHRSLGCSGFSRVDIILSKKKTPFVLEINTIPGLTSTSLLPKAARCVGIEFPKLCLKLIESAYEKK